MHTAQPASPAVAFVQSSLPNPAAVSDAEQVACDPTVPSEVLQKLYDDAKAHHDKTSRQWVAENAAVMAGLAQNPNTPLLLLGFLVSNYAPHFCANPIAPLVLLEKPDFLSGVGTHGQLKLLTCSHAPASLVRVLACSDAAPGEATTTAQEARHHIAYAGELENEWADALATVCRNYCQETSSADARQFHSDYAELGLLPATWPEAQSPLSSTYDPALSVALTGHKWGDKGGKALARTFAPNLSPALFKTLAELHDATVNSALVQCLQTPTAALQIVAGDDHSSVRLRVFAARHKNAQPALLESLAGDPNPVTRRLARRHKNAPTTVVEKGRTIAIKRRGATPIWYLVSGLHGKLPLQEITRRSESLQWMERLSAVFALSSGKTRLSTRRTALLQKLSGDANCFVRAAAKTCLADSNFRFAW